MAVAESLHAIEDFLGLLQLLGNAPAIVVQLPAGFGEVELLAQLLEQCQANIVLQLLELHGDCRLGQVQFLCRPGAAEVARNRLEDVELA
ncbi:hypothetical protein D3C84_1161250 [compost metagenome]